MSGANHDPLSWPCFPSFPHLKSQSGFSSPFDLCPSHGPLLALASASLLPWVRWEAERHITSKFWHVPPAPGLEERFQRSASQRNGLPGSPEKVGKAGVGVLVWGTGMLPRVKRAAPVAQTPPQPSPSGSRLPSPAAGRCQLHLRLCGRAAPSIPPDSRILTSLPRGKRLWWLRLSVEWSPV